MPGTAGPFALDLRHLEDESAHGQLLQPRFAAARTMLLDYFHSLTVGTPSERQVFRWEVGYASGLPTIAPLISLTLHAQRLPVGGGLCLLIALDCSRLLP